jgi:hypothetical protein
MATIDDRYKAATAYVRRAINAAKPSRLNPARYFGGDPTTPVGNELAQLEARWLRAANDLDRAAAARDAELLADRTQENLPGAPQDRVRSNLFRGEQQRATPAPSYLQEVANQVVDDWHWLTGQASKTSDAADKVADVLTLVAIGGGILLAIKALDAVAPRRDGAATAAELNRQLAIAADERDADNGGGRVRT